MRRSKQRQEMTAEEQHEADLTDMRCLVLCIGMLERVNGVLALCFHLPPTNMLP